MFSPRTTHTIVALTVVTCCLAASEVKAQNAAAVQYQARVAAMRQAQARANGAQPSRMPTAPAGKTQVVRTAQAIGGSSSRNPVGATGQIQSSPVISQGAMVNGGSPIVDSVITPPIAGQAIGSNVITPSVVSESIHSGAVVDAGAIVYSDEVVGGCDTCGDSCGYFDDCCGRGGCPDNVPCWTGPLARALRKGSYFIGANAFRHPAYQNPASTANQLVADNNFGAYAGFNLGAPLCRLTCGYLSGQFGLRSVQSNFGGNDFTENGRDQLFVTAGLYRRVDYGLQAGVVVDVLNEEFFTSSTIAQLRGELSWAYPSGTSMGFRFATSQQDDDSDGSFNGVTFQSINSTVTDHFRFFLNRRSPIHQGFDEVYLGWTDNDQFALGANFDIPIAQRVALEAGAAYYLSDVQIQSSNLGSTRIDDAFNVFVGFAFRPQGMSYYRSYDRPLLPVADNGTMIISRQ